MAADRSEVEELKLAERRQLARIKACAKVALALVVVWLLCALVPSLAAIDSLVIFGLIAVGVLFAYVYSVAWVAKIVTNHNRRTMTKLMAVAALALAWSVAYVGSYYAMLRPIPANSMLYPIPAGGCCPEHTPASRASGSTESCGLYTRRCFGWTRRSGRTTGSCRTLPRSRATSLRT